MPFFMREHGITYAPEDAEPLEELYPPLTTETQKNDVVSIEYKGVMVHARVTKRTVGARNRGEFTVVQFELKIISEPYVNKTTKKTLSLNEVA